MMEEILLNQFKQILKQSDITECVLTNSQGLCLLATSNAKPETAGLVSAIAEHAKKIDPENSSPIICLESKTRQCLIRKKDDITTAIFKKRYVDEVCPS